VLERGEMWVVVQDVVNNIYWPLKYGGCAHLDCLSMLGN
jgi:hypothetical protein